MPGVIISLLKGRKSVFPDGFWQKKQTQYQNISKEETK